MEEDVKIWIIYLLSFLLVINCPDTWSRDPTETQAVTLRSCDQKWPIVSYRSFMNHCFAGAQRGSIETIVLAGDGAKN